MVYDVFVPNWSAEVDMPATANLLRRASEELGKPMPPVGDFVDVRFLEGAMRELAEK